MRGMAERASLSVVAFLMLIYRIMCLIICALVSSIVALQMYPFKFNYLSCMGACLGISCIVRSIQLL